MTPSDRDEEAKRVDQSLEDRILALIAEAVPAQYRRVAITPQTRLKQDLGLDSIGMLALLFRLEQAFGIDLAAVDVGVTLAQLRTVGDTLTVGREVYERAAGRKEA